MLIIVTVLPKKINLSYCKGEVVIFMLLLKNEKIIPLMSLLIIENISNLNLWIAELKNQMPELDVYVSNQKFDIDDIDAILIWGHYSESLKHFPNLKVIMSISAGVEDILRNTDLPEGVPIVRLVSPFLSLQVSEYVILSILRFHRHDLQYQELRKIRKWEQLPIISCNCFKIGILGLGVIGLEVAQKLINLGFSVRGWSKNPKHIDGIDCFYGNHQLQYFLSGCQIIVCLLPLTHETVNILDRNIFYSLPKGAYLINVARGEHLVEEDLLEALTSEQLSGACLDVFRIEPLPKNHPFWTNAKIVITPHIASQIIPSQQVTLVINAISRLRSGLPFINVVNPQNGY